MESIIVASFQNLQHAEKGLDRMRELDLIDDIAVYNIALVHKKNELELEILYSEGPDTKHFPVKGVIAGTLIGALAGPFGAVMGSMVGGISASLDEYDVEKGQEEVLANARQQLKRGSYALLLHVDETDPALINFYIAQNNGVLTRTLLVDVYISPDMQEWDLPFREMSSGEKKLEKAIETERKAIRETIQEMKAKKEEKLKL